jgi:hypothetical protein
MVVTRTLAAGLFVVGIIWALVMAWIHLVMTGFTEPTLPLPIHFFGLFFGPAVLTIGSTSVMAMWHARLGSILVLAACAWLTWIVAPDCISAFIQPRLPLEAPKPFLILAILLAVVVATDVAAILMFRRATRASNKSLQPNADPR